MEQHRTVPCAAAETCDRSQRTEAAWLHPCGFNHSTAPICSTMAPSPQRCPVCRVHSMPPQPQRPGDATLPPPMKGCSGCALLYRQQKSQPGHTLPLHTTALRAGTAVTTGKNTVARMCLMVAYACGRGDPTFAPPFHMHTPPIHTSMPPYSRPCYGRAYVLICDYCNIVNQVCYFDTMHAQA